MARHRTLTIIFIVFAGCATAQNPDTLSPRRNVFKLVLTPRLLYSEAAVFSYERVMKPYQSLNITGGAVSFPKLFSTGGNLVVKDDRSRIGYTLGVDYRFYMKKEAKFGAPHGVYIGPYFSFYDFSNSRNVSDKDGNTGSLNTDIVFTNIGIQIGYQFVINDRWTFDCIFFGPSLSNYFLSMDLQGNFSIDEENDIANEILNRFPLLKDLLGGNTLTLHGNNSKWAAGYRFTASIGYKFSLGKKK